MSGEIPERGTDEFRWWHAGATAEAHAQYDGVQEGKAREVFDFVKSMAQSGYGPVTMTEMVASVYSCEWPLRPRIALAWRIVWWPIGNALRTRWRKATKR